ncbi:hypothetical protein D3C81_1693670 [compost metagenome]
MRAGGGAAVLPGQRGHVDDPPKAGLGQVRAEHLAAEEHAAQVQADHGVELFRADLHQWRGLGHGGVVHHYVQSTEVFQYLGQGLLEFGLAADIKLHRQGTPTLPSQLFGGSLGLAQVAVRHHNVEACCQQPGAKAPTQALAGSGYQCDLVHGPALRGCSRYRQGYRRC